MLQAFPSWIPSYRNWRKSTRLLASSFIQESRAWEVSKGASKLGMFDGLWGREEMSIKVQLVLGMEELFLRISSYYLDNLDFCQEG